MAATKQSVGTKVVILGAGFGGLYAAQALAGKNVSVTVLDRKNHHLFQPLLYQVATAALSPADIAYPVRAILGKQKNARVLLAEAVSVDAARRTVVLSDGEVAYNYLIIATGATHAYFGHDDWAAHAPGLKTLEDALDIRRRILLAFEKAEREPDEERRRALLTFVVVGGGPTGVEMAGAIAEIAREVMVQDFRAIDPRESRVLLVEAGPRILAGFPEDLSASARKSLEKIGVEIRTGMPVTAIEAERVRVGEQEVGAGTIVWAAGVQASPLARSLGVPLDRAGRVLVQPDCSIPGHPEVFVIGDLAAFQAPDGKLLPGVAPVAIQQGRYVANRIERLAEGRRPRASGPVPQSGTGPAGPERAAPPFHYKNRGNLATIGRAHAIADFGRFHLTGFIAWVFWLFVHILWLIGFRNRVVVMIEWAWAYLGFQRSARLITGDVGLSPEATVKVPRELRPPVTQPESSAEPYRRRTG